MYIFLTACPYLSVNLHYFRCLVLFLVFCCSQC
uniref:Uncharacterized protein n=1 Tax=Anguilla anguilla TaxID=7936 RepID=A0A0E9R1Q5_ANGAN